MIDRRLLSPLFAAALLAGCPSEGDQRYDSSDLGLSVGFICPGDPSGICDFSEDVELRVGSVAVDITPDRYETWNDVDDDGTYRTAVDEYFDCGVDRLCPEDDGYPGPDDGEADGQFQALWLAGFGNSRPMSGVADSLWARVTVLEQGETSIGVVSVDLVGWFYNEVVQVREAAAADLGLDHVIVAATHVHEAPDTLGQWGPQIARTGVNPEFVALIHASIQQGLRDAQAAAVPADVYGGSYSIPVETWDGTGVNNINLDTRDPNITDETVWTVRFTPAGSNETIATWVNFPNHPEASSSDNLLLTADFAHTLRLTVEEGAAEGPAGALAGLGGVATYFQGACGGMQTPLHVQTIDLDGQLHDEHGIPKAYAVGRATGYHALQAVANETKEEAPLLSLRARDLFVPVENTGFHVLMNAGVFDRDGYNYDEDELIGRYNQPDLLTEVSLLQIGGVASLQVPGELLPELAIGGYDGSHTGPVEPIVSEGNPNPPDLTAAPEGPYFKDLMPGTTKLVLGLANDEIGYIIPDYNYVLHEGSPYLNEADGDHYEETNSAGARTTGILSSAITLMLAWEPPASE